MSEDYNDYLICVGDQYFLQDQIAECMQAISRCLNGDVGIEIRAQESQIPPGWWITEIETDDWVHGESGITAWAALCHTIARPAPDVNFLQYGIRVEPAGYTRPPSQDT